MGEFNQNVFREGHFESWNDKFGKNFTDNFGHHKQQMIEKNIETGGAYQAAVSGAYGEFTIATVFKSLPDYYHVMNDILLQLGVWYRPYDRRYGDPVWPLVKVRGRLCEAVKKSTQIDHLIVSPFGIFVIETKNHKGWVFGDINGSVWTQTLTGENGSRAYGGHAHFTFMNPVRQNEGHMEALSQQLRLGRQYMTGMIVFTNPEAYLGNVNCSFCYTIDTLYDGILSYNQQIWSPKKTEAVIMAIERIDTNNYTLAKEHIKYVQDLQHRQEVARAIRQGYM